MEENDDDMNLQVGAWREYDEGSDGHGEEKYQQKQTIDHQSNLGGLTIVHF